MKLFISKGNVNVYLRKFIFPLTGMLLLIIIVGYNIGSLIGLSIYFTIDIVPAIYIIISYIRNDNNTVVNFFDRKINFFDGISNRQFETDDVYKGYIYKSASADSGGMPFLTMEHFFYVRLVLKSGEQIRLTCLLSPEIDQILRERLPGVPIERKKRGFNAFFLERFWDEDD